MLVWLQKFEEYYLYGGIAILIIGIYYLLSKIIKNSRMSNDSKRRSLSNIRTTIIFALLILFLVLWANELYQIIISLAALGAAFAIALKEVFLCFGGSFYRTFARPFTVGDRIQIGEIRGDVVDVGLMGTQVLEVGPKDLTHQYTGRMISIPNSFILTANVFNETDHIHMAKENYALHVFIVPISNDNNWEKHRDDLLECAKETCDKFIADANHYFTIVARKRQVDIPWIEPRVNIKFKNENSLDLIVRVTIPTGLKGTVEQDIIKKYLNKSHAND